MIGNCRYVLNSEGLWQCANPGCGYVYPKVKETPPRGPYCRGTNVGGVRSPKLKSPALNSPEHRAAIKKKILVVSNDLDWHGPGTELKKLLRKFKFKVKENCACAKHAKLMDKQGPEWCRKNLELIVDWLGEEAEKRSLPFSRIAGKLLVKLAIHNAEKAIRNAEKKTGAMTG